MSVADAMTRTIERLDKIVEVLEKVVAWSDDFSMETREKLLIELRKVRKHHVKIKTQTEKE